jgi:glucose-1-phosphate adenylyltransferase
MHSWSSAEECVLLPGVDVAQHARLRKVIVDRGVRIPQGLEAGFNAEEDARRFRRTEEGVVLITQAMLDALK